MFKIAERRLENNDNTPFARWKKILPNPTIVKTNDDTIKNNNAQSKQSYLKNFQTYKRMII